MANNKETLIRLISLLQMIPRSPARVSTSRLLSKLQDKGFDISARSLQRDLDSLETPFTLLRQTEGKANYWSFDRDAAGLNLPTLDTPTALALNLAESHLQNLLPQGVMQQLAPQFRAAAQHLGSLQTNPLAHWPRRVRAIPNGQALIPAEVDDRVWVAVSEALVAHQQLQITYLSRSKGERKTMRLHPQSLVSRHAVSYIVGMADDYEDLRHFALHRIEQAAVLMEPARQRDGHDLDGYVTSGAFAWLRSEQAVELVADIHPQTAWLLNETPLSTAQEITPLSGTDWQRLRATVLDSQETLWWILALNSRIRVMAPQVWVDEIRQQLEAASKLYDKSESGESI